MATAILPAEQIASAPAATLYAHVTFDDRGRARVGSNGTMRITMLAPYLVGEHKRTPGKMNCGFPHLTLADIHAGLLYYYDHRDQIDAEMAAIDAEATRVRAATYDEERHDKLAARLAAPTLALKSNSAPEGA